MPPQLYFLVPLPHYLTASHQASSYWSLVYYDHLIHHQLGLVVMIDGLKRCGVSIYENINKTQVSHHRVYMFFFNLSIYLFIWLRFIAERHISLLVVVYPLSLFFLGFMCSSPDTSRVSAWLTAHSVHMCIRVYVWYLARESGQAREHRNMKCLAVACSHLPAHRLASNTRLLTFIKTCPHSANGTFMTPDFFYSFF